MGFLFILPFFAALIGIFIAFICFIGIGLIIIGCTGIGMNKIYLKQVNTEKGVAKPLYNITSIILGVIFLLFPLGCTLFGIISSVSPK